MPTNETKGISGKKKKKKGACEPRSPTFLLQLAQACLARAALGESAVAPDGTTKGGAEELNRASAPRADEIPMGRVGAGVAKAEELAEDWAELGN